MTEKIIIAGFGGQGVLSLGQFLAYAAMHVDKSVTWLPSYGPEMRGGTANCSVVISDITVASPVIAKPNCLIALNKPSLDKFVNSVEPGGIVIVNSSIINDKVLRNDVKAYYINANDIALEAGTPKAANVVLLGAYIAITGMFETDDVKNTISKIFANKLKVIPLNHLALDLGIRAING